MTNRFLAAGCLGMAILITAASPHNPHRLHSDNKLRSAFTVVTPLPGGAVTELQGESDDETVTAAITVSKKGVMDKITLVQDGRTLMLPQNSYAGLTGTQHAWLEERGALTTLVVEGTEMSKETGKSKQWRLALLFHPEQLWRRRLSVEGQWRDSMTFYDRDDDMEASQPENRSAISRGFYNN